MTKPKKTNVMFLRKIDKEVKRKFAVLCRAEEAFMNEVVEAMMRSYLRDPRQFDNYLRATRTQRGK